MILPLLLLGVPFSILGILLCLSLYYTEERMAARLGQQFGFEKQATLLQKPDWKLGFHHQPQGRQTNYLMGYEIRLQGLPEKFHLVQRGAASSFLTQKGLKSERSGDEDFDGLFHHRGALQPGQRGLLVDLWQLLPDFGIGDGVLSGQVSYERSPRGLASLTQIVARLHALQKEFPHAENYVRTRPVGFLRRSQLAQESTLCWAGAVIAAAPALGYAAFVGLSLSDPGALGSVLLLATAAGFANCASQVRSGSLRALSALEGTRKLALVTGLVVLVLLVRQAPSPITAGFVAVMMLLLLQMTLEQLKEKWQSLLDN